MEAVPAETTAQPMNGAVVPDAAQRRKRLQRKRRQRQCRRNLRKRKRMWRSNRRHYGTAVITATTKDGKKSAQCKVTVGYGITYKLNGGTNSEENEAAYYKTELTLEEPSKKGYLFKGWYKDKKLKKKITQIAANSQKNLTVYAKWEKIKAGKVQINSLKNTKGKKAVLKLKKVSGASGYEALYGTKKNLKGGTVATAKKTGITLKGLAKNKTYYVKVRAYRIDSAGEKVYGAYSK